jgi:WhiB family transcriptional regulator, redox-sensing transcriptional regulator
MIERRFKHDPAQMAWVERARCIGEDPELFFPVGSTRPALQQVREAKAICRDCAVRDICLEWSLSTYQDAGVWGGLDEEERRAIRRQRRRDGSLAGV